MIFTVIELDQKANQTNYSSARKNKVEPLRALYKSYPNVEIVQIDDIAHGEFGDVLKGVDALIHTASPLPGRADGSTILKVSLKRHLIVKIV